ncbi:MAG TPA: pitrilysin family protein [Ignavibacteriaceae bacterium]|nr:pitrilysin family protein [Ignavibacteriaceae bacterium]
MSLNRKNKPEEISQIKFDLPQPEKFTLENGLKVIFIEKNNLPIVVALMIINSGSKYDPENKYGLANLTALTIDEGADGISALELSDQFDMLGSDFSISTDNDLINITLQSLSENFEKSFELFSKVIIRPDFNVTDFEREQKKIITRILQRKDKLDFLANQIFEKILFSADNDYAFPIIGYEETVSKLTNDDVKKFYSDFFFPENSALIIAGNIKLTELNKILKKYLTKWANKGAARSIKNSFVNTDKRISVYHKRDSVQTEIRAGHLTEPRNNNNYLPRLLLNTVLGGQFTSRINLNLRERNGYTYGATSKFQYYKEAAFFEVSTSVGIENTANAVKEIISELNLIKDGVKNSELDFAKSFLTKRFPLSFETYRQLVSGIAGRILYNLPSDYYSTFVNKLNLVDINEVNKAATEFIKNDRLTIVLAGDKEKIIPQIKDLGIEFSEVDLYGNVIS